MTLKIVCLRRALKSGFKRDSRAPQVLAIRNARVIYYSVMVIALVRREARRWKRIAATIQVTNYKHTGYTYTVGLVNTHISFHHVDSKAPSRNW